MKLCRFIADKSEYCGVLKGDRICAIVENNLFGDVTLTGKEFSQSEVRFICPTTPKNIFAIGLNYKQHALEMGMDLPKEPLMFLKAVSALNEQNGNIVIPRQTKELSCEAELAIVVKKKCKNISVKDAPEYILGYSMINDVTARDVQRGESQWARAKSFDGFCPYGPIINTDINTVGPGIKLFVNDKVVQDSVIDDMIFSPFEILSFVSNQCTLNEGDIIATGTPSGVTTIYPGEVVSVEIDNLGRLTNKVVAGDEQND